MSRIRIVQFLERAASLCPSDVAIRFEGFEHSWSSLSAGTISDQSAPMLSHSSANVLATLTDATRQQLIEILASSALSNLILRIGQ